LVTAYSLKRKNNSPLRGISGRLIAIQGFASLCAIGLVVAFAIAATLPIDMDLGAMLLTMDPKCLENLHRFVLKYFSTGIWTRGLLPFLLRPDWMLPLMAGLVAGGIAFSLNQTGPTRQSTRRSG